MLLRPSREEIDEEILDSAAGLIAQHGFRQTSVQAVADAVGYSKAGLLHRFPSKDALLEAVVAQGKRHSARLLAEVADLPVGRRRDLAAITSLAELAQGRPGFIALLLGSLSTHEDFDLGEELAPVGNDLLALFGLGDGCDDPARLVAVIGALGALAVTSLAVRAMQRRRQPGQDQHGQGDRTVPTLDHVIATCTSTLGHAWRAPDETAPAGKDH